MSMVCTSSIFNKTTIDLIDLATYGSERWDVSMLSQTFDRQRKDKPEIKERQ